MEETIKANRTKSLTSRDHRITSILTDSTGNILKR